MIDPCLYNSDRSYLHFSAKVLRLSTTYSKVSLVGTLENHSSLQFEKGKLFFVWKLFLKRCNNVETANARRIHYTLSCSILDEEITLYQAAELDITF